MKNFFLAVAVVFGSAMLMNSVKAADYIFVPPFALYCHSEADARAIWDGPGGDISKCHHTEAYEALRVVECGRDRKYSICIYHLAGVGIIYANPGWLGQ